MRLGPFIIVLFVMYLCLGLLNGNLDPTLQNFSGTNSTTSGTSFLQILTQPYIWQQNNFLLLLIGAVFVVSAITAVGAFFTRSDILTLAGLAGVFISMGAVPIVSLYSFITRNVGQFVGCMPHEDCTAALLIGTLTAGVVAVMWAMTILEWWLWRPATQ